MRESGCSLTDVPSLAQSKRMESVTCRVLVVELCWCSELAAYLRALSWDEPSIVCDPLELNNLDGHCCRREASRPGSKVELRWWLLVLHGAGLQGVGILMCSRLLHNTTLLANWEEKPSDQLYACMPLSRT